MTKDSILAASIQSFLDKGPRNPYNKPIFRLIWSEEAFEKRLGTYRTYAGNIFIREETKVELTKKYNFIHERWIFEQWFPPEVCMNPELIEANLGSYEARYVFDSGGN